MEGRVEEGEKREGGKEGTCDEEYSGKSPSSTTNQIWDGSVHTLGAARRVKVSQALSTVVLAPTDSSLGVNCILVPLEGFAYTVFVSPGGSMCLE